MTKKGIAIAIACLLFIGLEVFLIWSSILYYQQKDDYDKAWQSGYDTALQAKDEYDKTIAQLQAEKLQLSSDLSTAQSSLETLKASNESLTTQVETLTTQKTELEASVTNLTQTKTENELTIQTLNTKVSNYEEQISELQADITENETTIGSLNAQITNLNKQIAELESEAESNTAEIAELEQVKLGLENQITNLNAQISAKTNEINTLNGTVISLNNLVSKLQSTNELQAQTISNLNTQIVSLNTQISNLTLQINNNSGIVSNLQAKITQLENSIAYYEEYIAGLESGNQVVITAEFNGSVYNVQVIAKGSKVSIVEPTSTEYVVFNYWTVNGEQIDLNTYTFNESTKIVANCTYKYDVTYYVDNEPVSEQIIVSNGFAADPTEPTKTCYEFDGWSLNGTTVIDTSEYAITKNTNFYAVFTKLHTVQFNDGTSVVSTQTVRNGEYANAENVSVTSTQYKTFAGWTVGGSVVDVSSYIISADTIFTATYTYSYDVTFKSDNSTHNSQIVQSGNYPTEPTAPTKTGYEFLGWSLNGTDIVSVTSTQITANTTFIAVWKELKKTVSFVNIETGENLGTQTVSIGESATLPAKPGFTQTVFTSNDFSSKLSNLNYDNLTNNNTYYVLYECVFAGCYSSNNGALYISSNGIVILLSGDLLIQFGYVDVVSGYEVHFNGSLSLTATFSDDWSSFTMTSFVYTKSNDYSFDVNGYFSYTGGSSSVINNENFYLSNGCIYTGDSIYFLISFNDKNRLVLYNGSYQNYSEVGSFIITNTDLNCTLELIVNENSSVFTLHSN